MSPLPYPRNASLYVVRMLVALLALSVPIYTLPENLVMPCVTVCEDFSNCVAPIVNSNFLLNYD